MLLKKKQILKGCNPHNMSLNLRYQDHVQFVLWHSFFIGRVKIYQIIGSACFILALVLSTSSFISVKV